MKNFLIFLSLIYFINCQENFLLINAKFYPESNTIEYNGQKFILSSPIIPEKPIKKPEHTKQEKPEKPAKESKEEEEVSNRAVPFSGAFWFNLIAFLTLACFAGTMSGLTVGYLSIDSLYLEIKINNGTESEKTYAEKIYRLVHNHHWLLVTLLLCNSFACEAMPIFLSKLVNEMIAVIISVTVLLFVGEIVPQALCTGPNQMKIASFLAPFTYILMCITYPLSYPIAAFMDCVIGVQGKNRFCNNDLKDIIILHMKELMGHLNDNQIGYFTGFFDVVDKKIGELMLPIDKVTKINYQANINKVTLKRLIESGYSRIPVYKNNPNNLIGILRMKELVGKDLSKSYTLEQLGINLTNPIIEYDDTLFLNLFEKFKKGKSHMAFIYKKKKIPDYFKSENYQIDNMKQFENANSGMEIIGIITLEDLIEFWLKIPILDEEDYMHSKVAQRSRSRRRTYFDIFKNLNFQNKLNQYYDRRASVTFQRNEGSNNNNFSFDNNYKEFHGQNDEENESLISK